MEVADRDPTVVQGSGGVVKKWSKGKWTEEEDTQLTR